MQFDAHDTQMISGLPCKNDNSHDNALLYKFTRDEKRKHFFFYPPPLYHYSDQYEKRF